MPRLCSCALLFTAVQEAATASGDNVLVKFTMPYKAGDGEVVKVGLSMTFQALSRGCMVDRSDFVSSASFALHPFGLLSFTAASTQHTITQYTGRTGSGILQALAAAGGQHGSHASAKRMLASGGHNPVLTRLKCLCAVISCPQIVGNVPELGTWDAEKARAFERGEGDEWHAELHLPPGMYEFKVGGAFIRIVSYAHVHCGCEGLLARAWDGGGVCPFGVEQGAPHPQHLEPPRSSADGARCRKQQRLQQQHCSSTMHCCGSNGSSSRSWGWHGWLGKCRAAWAVSPARAPRHLRLHDAVATEPSVPQALVYDTRTKQYKWEDGANKKLDVPQALGPQALLHVPCAWGNPLLSPVTQAEQKERAAAAAAVAAAIEKAATSATASTSAPAAAAAPAPAATAAAAAAPAKEAAAPAAAAPAQPAAGSKPLPPDLSIFGPYENQVGSWVVS